MLSLKVAPLSPQKNVLQLLVWSFLLLVATVAVGKFSLFGWVRRIDSGIFDRLVPALQAVPGLTDFSRWATMIGALNVSYAMIAIGALIVAIQHRRLGTAGMMIAVLMGAHVFQRIVIFLVDGSIPAGQHVIGNAGPYFSGGVQRVIVVFGVLATVAAPQLKLSSRAVYTVAIGAGLFEGLTRLVLGRHWPFDVFAAIPIGLAFLWLFRRSLLLIDAMGDSPSSDLLGHQS